MKNLSYIENKTGQDLDFAGCSFILKANEKTEFSNDLNDVLPLHSIKDRFENSLINVYDQNNNLLEGQEFIEAWRIYFLSMRKKDKNYKIYRFLNDDALVIYGENFSITPKSIDYVKDVSTRLQRKLTFNKGFLVGCEYFEKVKLNESGDYSYINPILKVEIEYHVGSDGYVSYRNVTRSWQLENGTYSNDSKVTTKYYDKITSIEEGKTRRNNIINNLIKDVVGIVLNTNETEITVREAETIALPFFDENDGFMNKFFKGNIQPLIDSVQNDSINPFLDRTSDLIGGMSIKQYILLKLNESTLTEGEVISYE